MEWIECGERLPDEFEDCICCDGGIDVYPATHYGDGKFWVYHDGCYEDKVQISNPTHWMPLPPPPAE